MATAIKKLYLAPGSPRVVSVFRKVCEIADDLGQVRPGRATVYRYIEHLEATEPVCTKRARSLGCKVCSSRGSGRTGSSDADCNGRSS